MLSRKLGIMQQEIYKATIYKTLKWTEFTMLKVPLAAETLIQPNIIVWLGRSLLRCNYYHKYLACEQEDFCERCI